MRIARTNRRRVVDLAVALEPDLRAGRGERLIGALVQIDDAQPLGADHGVGMRERSVSVGAAMPQRRPHFIQHRREAQRAAVVGDHPVDAAHQRGIVYATKWGFSATSFAPCDSTAARFFVSLLRTMKRRGLPSNIDGNRSTVRSGESAAFAKRS